MPIPSCCPSLAKTGDPRDPTQADESYLQNGAGWGQTEVDLEEDLRPFTSEEPRIGSGSVSAVPALPLLVD